MPRNVPPAIFNQPRGVIEQAGTVALKVEPIGPRTDATLAALQRHRILGAACDTELRALLARSQIVRVPERETLFRQGDTGRAVAVVLTGFVKLSAVGPAGREIVFEICGPGSLFGELAVLNAWVRSADAVALADSEILSIPGEALRHAVGRSPEMTFALLKVVSRRLRHATTMMQDTLSLPGHARLAKALLQLSGAPAPLAPDDAEEVVLEASRCEPEAPELHLEVTVSQRELGAMTGLSRESINKQLAQWRDQGWVSLLPRRMTLRDPAALRRVVVEAGGA